MAMRLFTRAEFEEHLTNVLGLENTGEKTDTASAWKTASGRVILVPDLEDEMNPDYLLDDVYEQVQRIESE